MYYISPQGNDSSNGSKDAPWLTITEAVKKLKPGDTLNMTPGVYYENVMMTTISGTAETPIHIKGMGEAIINGNGGGTAFSIINCENIIIQGLTVTNANYGIDIRSTPERGTASLKNIIVKNNIVHGINGPKGGHGISVYGENPAAPITGLIIEENQVHNNKLYWSEALVVNGNIDGFIIRGNIVWNNDNIGIDIIGFEGTAGDNPEVDCARNGKVYDNIVYGSDTTGNEAYWSANHNVQGEVWTGRGEGPFKGKYDRCCGGIYVDGGWHIEIYHNFVFDNDLGIEVATEHKPPLVTKDVHVHDNIIASSTGWAGLIFGGYNSILGYTEDCRFENNILYDNATSIAVQKSRKNIIKNNVISGGWAALDFNGEMAANNDFMENYWENANNDEEYFTQLNELPESQRSAQIITTGLLGNPSEGDFTLKNFEGSGTKWRPHKKYLALYAEYVKAQKKADEAKKFLQSQSAIPGLTKENACQVLTVFLHENNHPEAEIQTVLKVASTNNLLMVKIIVKYDVNSYAQATTDKGVTITATN